MDVTEHMTRGAAWMVGVRWCVRLLDTAMLIVLARLLSPDDFGVYATAMLVVGLLEILGHAGIDIALMRRKGDSYYNAAWTIQVIQGVLIASALVLCAPLIATAFGEPRIVIVVRLLAIRPLIMAFNNIGVLTFTKDLDYRSDFRFGLIKKSASVVVIMILAPILQSYMAMVWGVVGGAAMTMVASYWVHPFRPRFTLVNVIDIWPFASWMVLYYAAEDMVEKMDRVVVASIANSAALGRYQVGWLVASTPLQGVLVPFWRAFIPAYAKQIDDPPALVRSYVKALGWTAVIGCAMGFGTIAVAHDMVLVVLGEKWLTSVSFVKWLALIPAIAGIVDSALMVITVMGLARISAFHSLLRLAVLLAVIPTVGKTAGIDAIPAAYLVTALCLLPIPFIVLTRIVPIGYDTVVKNVWRPVAAGLGMLGVVKLLHADGIDSASIRLVMDGATGGFAFLGILFGLWVLSGRPSGPESTAAGAITDRVAALSPGS